MKLDEYINASTMRAKTTAIVAVIDYLQLTVGAKFLKRHEPSSSNRDNSDDSSSLGDTSSSASTTSSTTTTRMYRVLTKRETHEKIGHAFRDMGNKKEKAERRSGQKAADKEMTKDTCNKRKQPNGVDKDTKEQRGPTSSIRSDMNSDGDMSNNDHSTPILTSNLRLSDTTFTITDECFKDVSAASDNESSGVSFIEDDDEVDEANWHTTDHEDDGATLSLDPSFYYVMSQQDAAKEDEQDVIGDEFEPIPLLLDPIDFRSIQPISFLTRRVSN